VRCVVLSSSLLLRVFSSVGLPTVCPACLRRIFPLFTLTLGLHQLPFSLCFSGRRGSAADACAANVHALWVAMDRAWPSTYRRPGSSGRSSARPRSTSVASRFMDHALSTRNALRAIRLTRLLLLLLLG